MSSSRLPSAKASIRAAGEFAGRWRGQTVVCLASGPSLTADDVEAVRLSGHPAIVVNCIVSRCAGRKSCMGWIAVFGSTICRRSSGRSLARALACT